MGPDPDPSHKGYRLSESLSFFSLICMIVCLKLTSSFSSHLNCRPFTDSMEIIATSVLRLVRQTFPDHEPFNHMSCIGYWDKKRINLHRDNSYCRYTGEFKTTQNCQKEGTVTAILAFGDTRDLQFFLCRHKKKTDGKKRQPYLVIEEPWVFELKHGTLFILHPCDEMLIDRFYSSGVRTFFQHGCEGVGKGCLSLGLVFRVTVHSRAVFSKTGRVVFTAEEKERVAQNPMFAQADEEMKRYVSSALKKERDEQTTALWLATEEKYFN